MKIDNQKNRRSKKPWLIAVIAVALIAGSLTVFALREQPVTTPSKETVDDTSKDTPAEEENKTPEEETPKPETPQSDPVDTDTSNFTLVTENEQFAIRKDPNSNTYLITLYAIINRPDQAEFYKEQLREYKANALTYLKDRGTNAEKAKILYEPKEAASL